MKKEFKIKGWIELETMEFFKLAKWDNRTISNSDIVDFIICLESKTPKKYQEYLRGFVNGYHALYKYEELYK